MFVIENVNNEKYLMLQHSANVFHEAHQSGEKRVRVINPDGEDYDLVKIRNCDHNPLYFSKRWPGQKVFFEYENYDENNEKSLFIDYLKRFDAVIAEEVNEYTVVLAGLFLRYTDAVLYFRDERIRWFINDTDRLMICSGSDKPQEAYENVLKIGDIDKDLELDITHRDLGPIAAFHNVFFFQGDNVFDMSGVRYGEITLDEHAGIGSILSNLSRYSQACESVGLRLINTHDKIGRFSVGFLNDILRFDLSADDADSTNTFFMKETAPYIATWFVFRCEPVIDKNILNPGFQAQLQEYADAVLTGRKFLGVLIRGTDYILVNANTERRMATVDEMIPVIDRCIEKYGYEGIYLATEDEDILNQMRAKYGRFMITNAQVRHTLAELQGSKLLADLEKDNKDGESYDATVVDDTVNYIYTLYMLSSCDDFVCSGYCNGYDLVCALNQNSFEHIYLYKCGEWDYINNSAD